MKKMTFFLFVLLTMILASCADDEGWNASDVCPEAGTNRYGMPNRGTFVDERDGRVYKYTTIGDQVWMAENLKFNAKYSLCYGLDSLCSDGGMGHQCILKTTNLDVVGEKIAPDCEDVKCVAERFCDRFGRFYSLVERGTEHNFLDRDFVDTLCPIGWHVPTKVEYEHLLDAVGGSKSFRRLVSKDSTANYYVNAEGHNDKFYDECGFNALFAGYFYSDGVLNEIFKLTRFATSTSRHETAQFDLYLGWRAEYISNTMRSSVRCLKD